MKRKKKSGGQGRCKRSSEAFVKIQNIYIYIFFFLGGGRVGGMRVDGNGEVKLLRKFKKKTLIYLFYSFGGVGSGGGVGIGG